MSLVLTNLAKYILHAAVMIPAYFAYYLSNADICCMQTAAQVQLAPPDQQFHDSLTVACSCLNQDFKFERCGH